MNDYIKKCQRILSNKEDQVLKKLLTEEYTDKKLIIPIGICDNKEPIYMNMESVQGLFVGGTTGSGKSIFLDTIIVSLMLKNSPDEVKFLFIDPKKIELGEYDGIPYIITKKKMNISDARKGLEKIIGILKIVEERIDLLCQNKIKSIDFYNAKQKDKLPHIFIVIDEASDILNITNAQKIFEQILDYGKQVGIHIILATNSYLEKEYQSKFLDHFKYQISFDMSSKEQAKYMEIAGCDLLKNSGNGLIKCPNNSIYNFQAPFVSDKGINNTINDNNF